MKAHIVCFIVVFVGLLAPHVLGEPNAITPEHTTDEEQVLVDCRHPNYRTYIKCLKRQTRQDSSDESRLEMDSHCMMVCLKKCETEMDCGRKCKHCLKRTKIRLIAEYELECRPPDCKNETSIASTNITTNIDIKNVIQNVPPSAPPTPVPTLPTPFPTTPPARPPSPPQQPHPLPQLQPQAHPLFLLLFFAAGQGGCSYPQQWPCVQQMPVQNPVYDCSGCGNPVLQYTCHISCPPPRYVSNCTGPHCVGGVPYGG